MNKNALVISLRNLIEKGNEISDMHSIREYIGLYNPTKEYIRKYRLENEVLNSAFEKLPDFESREFKNPFYRLKSFIFEKMKFGNAASGRWTLNEYLNDPIDAYPERTKYILDVESKAREISLLCVDLISRLD